MAVAVGGNFAIEKLQVAVRSGEGAHLVLAREVVHGLLIALADHD
jgi:hypothetical protein